MNKLFFLLALFVVIACDREEVNPSDYPSSTEIKPNEIVLKTTTYLLEPEDKPTVTAVHDTEIMVDANAGWLSTIKVGSVIVNTADDPGDTLAYFRKVLSINTVGDQVILTTRDATLPEAYSRYIIDSRSSETILVRTSPISFSTQCTPANNRLKNWIGLSFGVEPKFDYEISYDVDETYFSVQFDSAGTIPLRVDVQLKDLYVEVSGSIKFKGSFEAGPAIELGPPLDFLVIPYTGLAMYFQPKVKFKVKVQGEITSPTITFNSGPHNFFMIYDESMAEPLSYSLEQEIIPEVFQTNDWHATASGKAEIQMIGDVFCGIIGAPKLAKTGISVWGYANATAEQKGNFSDLQPRVSFNSAVGVGAKAFAELSFLGSEGVLGNSGWVSLSGKLESPEFKDDIRKWNIGNMNTCLKYNSVEMYVDNFETTNEIFLTVDCPGCMGNGFLAWVNDIPVDNGLSFAYNQSAIITLPPGLEMFNTIAIQDNKKAGCYLKDDFLNPELFNANCTKFTDSRDGNSYCMVQIGSQTWMGENLRYAGVDSLGHWYQNENSPDTLLFGRLYSFEEIYNGQTPNEPGDDSRVRGICPQGWHLPNQAEWRTLRDASGGAANAGKNLKLPSADIWPGADLPATSLFNASSAGEYYPWHEGHGPTVSGNQFKKTTYWTSERLANYNSTVKPVVVIIDDSNRLDIGVASISQSEGFFGISSIEDIGYSCRCIKD